MCSLANSVSSRVDRLPFYRRRGSTRVPRPPELARPAAPPENRGAQALRHTQDLVSRAARRTSGRACCPQDLMMFRLVATATAATALLFSPTPGVLVLSPALTGPRTTFSVGPHAGESYERVWREDPQFCVWALEQRRPVWKSRYRAGVASMAWRSTK